MIDKITFAYNKGYRITEQGKVLNKEGKLLDGYIHKGYIVFGVRYYGKPRHFKVHRLQAFQKFGEKLFEEGIMVRHLDGDPLNNRWDNIAIGTNQDNQLDVPEAIRIERALHATSFIRKYNKEEVRKFHEENGNSYKETMKEFGISSKGTLNFILKSKTIQRDGQ